MSAKLVIAKGFCKLVGISCSPWTTSPHFKLPCILLLIPFLTHLSKSLPDLDDSGWIAFHLNVVISTSTKSVPLVLRL